MRRSLRVLSSVLLTLVLSPFPPLAAEEATPETPEAWRVKAAEGDDSAMVKLAQAHESGEGVAKNLVTALDWYRQAADKLNYDAALTTAQWYETGRGTKPDPVRAFRYYLVASVAKAEGDEAIQRLLAADSTLPAKLVTIASPETQAIIAKAQAGDPAAMWEAATLYFGSSNEIYPDEEAGIRLMQASAAKGYAPGQAWLGEAYGGEEIEHPLTRKNGERFLPEDQAKSIAWLKQAAAQSHPGASYELGQAYAQGHGVEKNLKEAYRLLDIAAKGNIEYAEFFRDKVLEENPEAAADIISLAPATTQALVKKAEAGDAAAQFALSQLFAQGQDGLPYSFAQSLKWKQQAAEGGLKEAQYQLAYNFERGVEGATKDIDAALKWYRKSADQGLPEAQVRLGELYSAGEGVDLDLDQAGYWWRKAASLGSKDAQKHIEFYEKGGHTFAPVEPVPADETEEQRTERKYAKAIPAGIKGETRKLFLADQKGSTPNTTFQIAQAYLNGRPEDGLPKNVAEGESWMQRSAASRNPYALAYFENKGKQGAEDEAAKQVQAFNENFGLAPDLSRRKRAVTAFSNVMAQSQLPREEAIGLFMRAVVAQAGGRADDMFEYLMASAGFPARDLAKEEYLGSALAAGVRAKSQQYMANFNDPHSASNQEKAPAGAVSSAAAAGNADAQYEMGMFYFKSTYRRDSAQGTEWLTKAAANGHRAAAEYLANLGKVAYLSGQHALLMNKRTEAVQQFVLAAEYGVHDGDVTVGDSYAQNWIFSGPHYERAAEWYQRAADHGQARGLAELGRMHANGLGFPKDEAAAVKLYRQAADKGETLGLTELGRCLVLGRGVARDDAEALKWFQQAADKRIAIALTWVKLLTPKISQEDRAELVLQTAGQTFVEGAGDVFVSPRDLLDYAIVLGSPAAKAINEKWPWPGQAPVDVPELAQAYAAQKAGKADESRALFMKAAAQGDTAAMLQLARLAIEGKDGESDYATAMEWLTKAGEGGLLVGWLSARELEAVQLVDAGDAARRAGNLPQAIRLYREAAQMGQIGAMLALARDYENGLGVERPDLLEARRWCELAVIFGHPNAPMELKRVNARLVGRAEMLQALEMRKKQDMATALALFEKAAAMGNLDAISELASAYAEGTNGVKADLPRALKLYEQAADLGSKSDAAARDRLRDKIAGKSPPPPSMRDLLVEAVAARKAGRMAEAAKLFERAVDAGSVAAMSQLGLMYQNGEGVAKDNTKALAWFDRAAKAGDKNAETSAFALREIISVQPAIAAQKARAAKALEAGLAAEKAGRLEEARRHYEMAAKDDESQAMERLGLLFERGKGGPKDLTQAREWYKKAALLGNEDAQAALDMLTIVANDEKVRASYEQAQAAADRIDAALAPAGSTSPNKANPASQAAAPVLPEPELLKKAQAGDALAQFDYGNLLKKRGDQAGASTWFHRALDNPKASEEVKKWASYETMDERLAEQAAQQKAEADTKAQAADLALKAATTGDQRKDPDQDPDALWAQAKFAKYAHADEEAQTKMLKAAKLAEKAGPETKHILAGMIMQGSLGVPKDPERGRKLLVESAEAGFPQAKLDYALALLNGVLGFEKDVTKGTQLLNEVLAGADSGTPEIKHQVAMILFQGAYGIPADRPRAVKFLNAAANAGVPISMFELGRALLQGLPPDLPADPSRGVALLKKVAELGNTAQVAVVLGQAYEKGIGVTASPDEALAWYKKAEALNVPGAKEAVAREEAAIAALKH